MAHEVSKLNKLTVSVIAFFFGIGMLCTAVGIGLALPSVLHWLLAHSRLVLKASMIACLLPIVWLLGLPVAKLLDRR
jgi:hypothetical protein